MTSTEFGGGDPGHCISKEDGTIEGSAGFNSVWISLRVGFDMLDLSRTGR